MFPGIDGVKGVKNKDGVRQYDKMKRKAKPAVYDPATKEELIPAVREGQPFADNVKAAGIEARTLLDDMGKVLINGLENHKNSIRVAFKHMPTQRVNKYLKNVDKNIKTIKEGME